MLFWTHPDHRWVINLPVTRGADAPESPREAVLRVLGGMDVDVEVLTDSEWTAAAHNATHFGRGRTFLVGDAAHRVPPAGATGVSSALADVHNLAWKLAAVVHDWADESLLASYAVEREAVAATTTEEARLAWIAMSSPEGEPFSGRSLRQLDMGYQYRSTAVAPCDGPPTDLPGDYQPNAAPGSRAPHMWLSGEQGRTSTVDLFDRGFTLLAGPEGQSWVDAAALATTRTGIPLSCHSSTSPAGRRCMA